MEHLFILWKVFSMMVLVPLGACKLMDIIFGLFINKGSDHVKP